MAKTDHQKTNAELESQLRGATMHERSPKETALDVIIYERDLLQHCANTVDVKMEKAQRSPTAENRAEYYLTIEGFLLHFRNLLGFFINKKIIKKNVSTDLTLDQPEKWAEGRPVNQSLCKNLTERAKEVNETHGIHYSDVNKDCYGKISWFLQHCTDHRYKVQRDWDIARMYADLSPILDEFVASVMPVAEVPEVISLGAPSYGTTTITKSDPLL
jgi:hypothetical protein